MDDQQDSTDGRLIRGYVDTQGLYNGLYDSKDRVDRREEAAHLGGYPQLIAFYASLCSFAERLLPLIDNQKICWKNEEGKNKEVFAKDLIGAWIDSITSNIDFNKNALKTGVSHFQLWQHLGKTKQYLHLAGLKSGALQKSEYERSVRSVVRGSFK